MKIKNGDLVKVIVGNKNNKNKIGEVIKVFIKTKRVQIKNVCFVKKHLKPQRNSKNPDGGIIKKLSTVHISNIMFMSKKHNRPLRLGFSIDESGKKTRIGKGKNIIDTKL